MQRYNTLKNDFLSVLLNIFYIIIKMVEFVDSDDENEKFEMDAEVPSLTMINIFRDKYGIDLINPRLNKPGVDASRENLIKIAKIMKDPKYKISGSDTGFLKTQERLVKLFNDREKNIIASIDEKGKVTILKKKKTLNLFMISLWNSQAKHRTYKLKR
jgi:hypothetical protein